MADNSKLLYPEHDGEWTFEKIQKVYDALMHGEVSGVLTEASGGAVPVTIIMSNAVDRTWVTV